MMSSKQFEEQYGYNPSSEQINSDKIYNTEFHKSLKELQNRYDPDLKQSPKNLQNQPEIKLFLNNNRDNITELLDYKMDNIARQSKVDAVDVKDALTIAKTKCFEDAEISFLNKIDSTGKWNEGIYKGRLVGESFLNMIRKLQGYSDMIIESSEVDFIKKSVTSAEDKIKLQNLEMLIPEKTVKESSTITFGIKNLYSTDFSSSFIKNITRISNAFEITPHNVKFDKHITLKFNNIVTKNDNMVGLFVQNDSEVDRQLDKWKIIPYNSTNQTTSYDFSLRSFSFMFLGDIKNNIPLPLKDNPGIKSKLKPYEYIYPGLNFRASCNNDDCEVKKDGKDMIIPLEFKLTKCNVAELDDEHSDLMICSSCKKPGDFVVEKLIKEIIIFRAHGEINYRLDSKTSKADKDTYNTNGNELLIYGTSANLEVYKFFKITIEKQLTQPSGSRKNLDTKIAAGVVKVDKHGNPEGSVFDLGNNGAFTEFKLIIGKFFNLEGFTKDGFEERVGKALTLKGFQWKCTENEDDFLKELHKNDIAWIISSFSSKIKNSNFVDEVIKFYSSKKHLLLWEDNDSTTGTHTVDVLKKLYQIQLQGNDLGQNIMKADTNATKALTFDSNHEIFHGIMNLYEGVTICYPNKKPDPLKVVGTNSSGHPNVMCLDQDYSHGRMVVDCGFTKLFKEFWDTAGTARYVSNATCWLAGATYDYSDDTGYDAYRS
jgi:hypothetical protein